VLQQEVLSKKREKISCKEDKKRFKKEEGFNMAFQEILGPECVRQKLQK
jgi:hypothetical protein